jgi:hypothetical protein
MSSTPLQLRATGLANGLTAVNSNTVTVAAQPIPTASVVINPTTTTYITGEPEPVVVVVFPVNTACRPVPGLEEVMHWMVNSLTKTMRQAQLCIRAAMHHKQRHFADSQRTCTHVQMLFTSSVLVVVA